MRHPDIKPIIDWPAVDASIVEPCGCHVVRVSELVARDDEPLNMTRAGHRLEVRHASFNDAKTTRDKRIARCDVLALGKTKSEQGPKDSKCKSEPREGSACETAKRTPEWGDRP